MRRSFSPVGVTALAFAFMLAGCGEAVPGHERLAGASERTEQEGTAHVTVESRMEQTGEGGRPMDITFAGEGQVDFAAERMHLAMQVHGMPSDEPIEAIHDADILYLRPGARHPAAVGSLRPRRAGRGGRRFDGGAGSAGRWATRPPC